ncbi:uncharacterized protein TRAVEDRAFT_52941 [Trametes versicolor FP-101664 SS1]|uniref:uncharacterized protein n=1 Tax=Trametes versicolor (strain FP-101664) TaxID=717944 RepID=UPI000462406F|nr:uncharacterized protein TRAVEDRAFT_52941 [Trametes versicolor FP-101664 SS1]EIW52497.1 hypothetical protein TRAVEDRAFT_52941 [Trametes versicolor FP-101664 SS1]
MEECLQDLQHAPRNHSSAKASALVRDNHRCMVTGLPDYQALSLNLTPALPNNDFAMTQCSHIFPEVWGNIVIGGSAANQEPLQEKEAATSWNTLKRFGCADVSAELGSATQGANLHRLENILTLDVRIHLLFDAMNLWFEAVKDQPNCYNVKLAPNRPGRPPFIPERVQFVSHRPELPLPSPRYLEVHAACCRVAHMSGAAEYLDLIYRHMEELEVLANNGASADVLTFALHRRLAVVDPV